MLGHQPGGVPRRIVEQLLSELTKFAAVLVFGALLTPAFFSGLSVGEWAVALLSLVLFRPASVLVSLWRADLPRRERFAAPWFGPKGFASVVYGCSSSRRRSRSPRRCSRLSR